VNRKKIPPQPVDDNSIEGNEDEISSLQSYDVYESDDELTLRIREAEERVKLLSATKDSLDRKVAAKLRLEELEKQQRLLEISIADANRRLSADNSEEIVNSNLSTPQARTDDLGINRSLWDAPPVLPPVMTAPVTTSPVPVAPVITGTMFVNDDGVVFFSMNKKTAATRIKKCLPFGRAVDSERKKLLPGDECMDFDIQSIKDKLIGFAHRTTTDLMTTGADLGRFTVAPIWMSTSKLADDALLALPVMTNVEKLKRLLTFQFAFRDYSVLSLDDFIKGGYLEEEDTALLRATLLRTQELMAGVFGSSFSKVFQTFIDAIQDAYRGYDGEFLRFLIEEVLYRYGQLMSEPWSESLKVAYNLQNIHSPGNAALLLTTLVNFIVPTRTNLQMFL